MTLHFSRRIAAAAALALFTASCGPAGAGGDATVSMGDATVSMGDVTMPPSDAGATGSYETLVRMCMLNNACGYQSVHLREADRCVREALEDLAAGAETRGPEHRIHFARMLECARTASTCDDYVRCADFGTACSGMREPRCNGTVLDQCSQPGGIGPRTFDCALFGSGSCVSGQCVYPAGGAPCTNVGQSRCDANTRVWCRPSGTPGMGTEVREPCAGSAVCIGSGTFSSSEVACAPVTPCSERALRCDGDTVVLCNTDPRPGATGFVELRTNCALAGGRCMTDARGRAACVPAASECTAPPSGTSGTCDGTAIRVCVEGRIQRLECASVGRASCVMYPGVPAANIPPSPVCE